MLSLDLQVVVEGRSVGSDGSIEKLVNISLGFHHHVFHTPEEGPEVGVDTKVLVVPKEKEGKNIVIVKDEGKSEEDDKNHNDREPAISTLISVVGSRDHEAVYVEKIPVLDGEGPIQPLFLGVGDKIDAEVLEFLVLDLIGLLEEEDKGLVKLVRSSEGKTRDHPDKVSEIFLLLIISGKLGTFDSLPNKLTEVEITAKKSYVRPEHVEGESYVDLKVSHEEAISKVVGEAMLVIEVPYETKEAVVGLSSLVREEGDHAGDIDSAEETDQDEGLEQKYKHSKDDDDDDDDEGETNLIKALDSDLEGTIARLEL